MNDNIDGLKAPWRSEAPCLEITQADPSMGGAWINEESVLRATAEAVCETCPVAATCLEAAIEGGTAEGLRGGYWFSYGALLSRDKMRLDREHPQYKKKARTRHRKDFAAITNGEMAS